MSAEVALGLLHDCLGPGGSVIPTKHFRDELKNEGMSFQDALQVLRSGRISKPPEIDIKTRDWNYTIEGYAPCGTWLCIIFCFKYVNAACLITVFSVRGKGRTT